MGRPTWGHHPYCRFWKVVGWPPGLGTSPPSEACRPAGRPAPRQGCVREGAHGVTSVTQKWAWAQREREGTFPRVDKIAPLCLHGVSVSRAPQESAGWIQGCWGW